MKIKQILFTAILSGVSLTLLGQSKQEKLHQLIESWSVMNKFNGSILVAQKGQILLDKGYGYRNVAAGLQNESATIYQIGSATKQFTAAAILKLQEKKMLNVKDKLSKYYPAFPEGDKIMLENLLTHTSGIFNYTDDPAFMQSQVLMPISEQKMVEMLQAKPLGFAPGTGWAYSNSNYMLLGYIIQKVSKKPYEQVIRDMFFKPLNMRSSGFDYKGLKNANKATGYFVISKEMSKEAPTMDSTVSYAAGGIYSTTGDLYKWHQGLQSNRILSKASLDKASTPYKNKYGYGLSIDSIFGKKVVAHGGMTFGFTSNLVRVPQDDIFIAILNNFGDTDVNRITKDILAIIYDKPYKLPEGRKEIQLSADALKKYTGTFELAPQFSIVFTVEGSQLFAQATGQPKMPLFAEKEDLFFLKVVDAQIEFKKDAQGNVNEMLLIQGGRSQPGKKVN